MNSLHAAILPGSRARNPRAFRRVSGQSSHSPPRSRDQPYFYLSWWATHRDHAGRGLGSVLIKENLAEIDATGLPCFLESTNPVNLPRYEALGFERRGSSGRRAGP
jgi:GNAT superfamily N-acetyltransferase